MDGLLCAASRDKEDPKKKHEHDLAEAKRAARAAANRGWAAARGATEREVKSKAELKAILAREEHSTAKVKIDLDIQDREKAWHVEAKARVDEARATDTEGHGWIARGDGGQPWYAARDLSEFNRKLLEGGLAELQQSPAQTGRDEKLDEHAQYDHKVRQGKQVIDRLQQRVDGEIRGLEASIEMEPWSGVEQDHLIDTELSIKPNKSNVRGQVHVEEESLEKKWGEELARMHSTAKDYVLGKFKSDKEKIAAEKQWSGVETIIRGYAWFTQFLHVGYNVAAVLIPLVIDGIKQAIAKEPMIAEEPKEKHKEFAERILDRSRPKVHAGQDPYKQVKESSVDYLLTQRSSPTAAAKDAWANPNKDTLTIILDLPDDAVEFNERFVATLTRLESGLAAAGRPPLRGNWRQVETELASAARMAAVAGKTGKQGGSKWAGYKTQATLIMAAAENTLKLGKYPKLLGVEVRTASGRIADYVVQAEEITQGGETKLVTVFKEVKNWTVFDGNPKKLSEQVDHLTAQVLGYLSEPDCDKVVVEIGSGEDQWPEEVKNAMKTLSESAARYTNKAGEKKSFKFEVV